MQGGVALSLYQPQNAVPNATWLTYKANIVGIQLKQTAIMVKYEDNVLVSRQRSQRIYK